MTDEKAMTNPLPIFQFAGAFVTAVGGGATYYLLGLVQLDNGSYLTIFERAGGSVTVGGVLLFFSIWLIRRNDRQTAENTRLQDQRVKDLKEENRDLKNEIAEYKKRERERIDKMN